MRIDQLSPNILWKHFDAITKIPRPSKKEDKIIQHIIDFANQHQLTYKRDDIGNIIVRKDGTAGRENLPCTVLQSHLDMVCEKNHDVKHNFETDAIQTYIEGEWIKAKGTTLGADNGIGVAAQLAILEANDIEHGPLECLFTVDEETGLTGAFALQKAFFCGNKLINLDSEDDGEVFIGCAGGLDTRIEYPFKTKPAPKNCISYRVIIKGLKGGHSGDDIHRGYANAIKLIARLLYNVSSMFTIGVSDISGGNLHNAIPREASALICIPDEKEEEFLAYFNIFINIIKAEYQATDPGIIIDFNREAVPKEVLSRKSLNRIIWALNACPNGVIHMSSEMPGLVETSTNLAKIRTTDDKRMLITTSQRSSVASRKEEIAGQIASVFLPIKASVKHSDSYPGWKPNPHSALLETVKSAYEQLFGNPIKVRAIHAGLECGLFLEKYPGLDMVSVGPTIKGAHSPNERMHIPTVEKFWNLLVEILKSIS